MLRSRVCLPPKFKFCEIITEMKLLLNNHPGNGQRCRLLMENTADNGPFFLAGFIRPPPARPAVGLWG